MTSRNEYWHERFKDNPTADQINHFLRGKPKRKISSKEQRKIDDFINAVDRRGKMLSEEYDHDTKHSD